MVIVSPSTRLHQDVVGMRYCLTGVRHPTGAIQVGVGFDTVGVSLEMDALAIQHRKRMPGKFQPDAPEERD